MGITHSVTHRYALLTVTKYVILLLMVTCSYCNADLKRDAYCSPAHKMRYLRAHTHGKTPIAKAAEKKIEKSNHTIGVNKKVKAKCSLHPVGKCPANCPWA